MNYQKLACWGDSQSFGARTYGCYPLHLVSILNKETPYTWTTLNLSTNGHTARDLWFRLCQDLLNIKDTYSACVLIGANDVGKKTPVDIFAEYYAQCLDALSIAGFKSIHVGEIPPIFPDSHAFFPKDSDERRESYNMVIRKLVANRDNCYLCLFDALEQNCYVDPVHFNDRGNQLTAEAFAKSIIEKN